MLKTEMTQRQAIIIDNLVTFIMDAIGDDNFYDTYGSIGQYLEDEIGLTGDEVHDYSVHMRNA